MAGPKPQMDLFTSPPGRRIWTVRELTGEVRRVLEGKWGTVWVSGEISNFKAHRSGHCYFSLKDDGAQIAAVLFRGQRRYLKFDPRDGQEVLVRGRLTVYEQRGQYQIIVDQMEPKGLGALQAAFEQLKEKLRAEGLFDEARKQPVPHLPRRIGVVTSPTGAAVRDFLRVLHRRHPGISVLVAPARVQGNGASAEVARQLARLDARGDCDVLVVTRGGGSIEDLWAFNEEPVARAIAACRTPVVSAVGHEVDFTIADFVADRRCPTPSAAAEQLAPELRQLRRDVRQGALRLARALETGLDRRRMALERLWGRVEDPRHALGRRRLALEDLRGRLERSLREDLGQRRRALDSVCERLDRTHPRSQLRARAEAVRALAVRLERAQRAALDGERRRERRLADALAEHSPRPALRHERQRLGAVREGLLRANEKRLADRHHAVERLRLMADALSPMRVLGRGYALVRTPDGRVVRGAGDVAPGDDIDVRLMRGRLSARVTGAYPDDPPEGGEER